MADMSPEEIMELQKQNCIFCKIISKEIPAHEVYSDDKILIILDINPVHEGHCLILPKQHYQILPQLPDDLIEHIFLMAKRTSRLLLKSLGIKGTSIFVANGALAGQKAPHFMIHVIPRKAGDMLFKIPKNNVKEEELKAVQNKLVTRITGKPVQVEKIEKKPSEVKDEPGSAKNEPEKQPEKEPKQSQEEQPKKEQKSKDIDLDKISGLFG